MRTLCRTKKHTQNVFNDLEIEQYYVYKRPVVYVFVVN